MQVYTQTWQPTNGSKFRPNSAETALAVEGVDDRTGGQRGGASRGGRQPGPEKAPERTGHKQVFVARSLSSTLTALHIASVSPPVADVAPDGSAPVSPRSDDATSLASASLDDLLSGLLSAAVTAP